MKLGDWVTARAECLLAKAFTELKSQIKRDVEIRNSLRDKESHFKFDFGDNGSSFIVLIEPHTSASGYVTFNLIEKNIQVQDMILNLESAFAVFIQGQCRHKLFFSVLRNSPFGTSARWPSKTFSSGFRDLWADSQINGREGYAAKPHSGAQRRALHLWGFSYPPHLE